MNSSCDLFCQTRVPLLPTWQPPKHVVSSCAQDPLTWLPPDAFINRTVPCPPSKNLCLFWDAINPSKNGSCGLDQSDIETIISRCGIPSYEECQLPTPITPRIDEVLEGYPACGTLCLVLVVISIVIFLGALGLIIWCARRRSKRESTGFSCCGVIFCDGGHIFTKPNLGRTESRAPAIDGDSAMDRQDGREKKSKSTFYVIFTKDMKDDDEAEIGEKPSMTRDCGGRMNEGFVMEEGEKLNDLIAVAEEAKPPIDETNVFSVC